MKTNRYILLFLIFFTINLYGGSDKLVKKMNYETSYKKALEKAKESGKPIMMMIGQEGCPYCNKFESKTLITKTIDSKVKKDFIPLTVLKFKDKDKYPPRLSPSGVPTVLFIEPNSQEVFYKSFGYKSKREYKVELKKALNIFNQK